MDGYKKHLRTYIGTKYGKEDASGEVLQGLCVGWALVGWLYYDLNYLGWCLEGLLFLVSGVIPCRGL